MRRMSREFFINKVASWLPEDKHISLNILKDESTGKITIWNDKNQYLVIKDQKGKEILRTEYNKPKATK